MDKTNTSKKYQSCHFELFKGDEMVYSSASISRTRLVASLLKLMAPGRSDKVDYGVMVVTYANGGTNQAIFYDLHEAKEALLSFLDEETLEAIYKVKRKEK